MTGERVPLFRRTKAIKKIPRDTGVTVFPGVTASPPAVTPPPPLLQLERGLLLKLAPFCFRRGRKRGLPKERSGPNPSTSKPRPEEDAPTPQVTTGYSTSFLELPYTVPGRFRIDEESNLWRKQDVFRSSRPLMLER
ncbi:hypothetical protein LIER_03681 [Lithospermum erythrorhizon]|uniref:Uncharacterized protein n=1 Tax=Lithospermum erythrorhizon TaxID=34254 RepID=A0AAV3NY06_LITER